MEKHYIITQFQSIEGITATWFIFSYPYGRGWTKRVISQHLVGYKKTFPEETRDIPEEVLEVAMKRIHNFE